MSDIVGSASVVIEPTGADEFQSQLENEIQAALEAVLEDVAAVEGSLSAAVAEARNLGDELAGIQTDVEVAVGVDASAISDEIDRELDDADLELDVEAEDAEQAVEGVTDELEEASQTASRVGKALATSLTIAAGAAAGLLVGLVAVGTEYNTLQQRSRAAFTTILGSTEAAVELTEQLEEFSRSSPFPREAFIRGTQQLVGFGFQASQIVPTLGAIQDGVAALGGGAAELETFIDVFATIQSTGRATTEDLQRLNIVGVDAFEFIGRAAGKTGAQIRSDVTAGTVGARQAISGLVAGLEEDFGGAAAGLKDTFVGAVDRVKAAFRDLGSALVEPFVAVEGGGLAVEFANELADAIRAVEAAVVPILEDIRPRLEGFFSSIPPAIDRFIDALDSGAVQDFFDVIAGLGPAVAGVTGAIVALGGTGIPILGSLLPTINPFFAAFAAFVAASPELRESFIGLAGAVASVATAIEPILPVIAALIDLIVVDLSAVADTISIVLEEPFIALPPAIFAAGAAVVVFQGQLAALAVGLVPLIAPVAIITASVLALAAAMKLAEGDASAVTVSQQDLNAETKRVTAAIFSEVKTVEGLSEAVSSLNTNLAEFLAEDSEFAKRDLLEPLLKAGISVERLQGQLEKTTDIGLREFISDLARSGQILSEDLDPALGFVGLSVEETADEFLRFSNALFVVEAGQLNLEGTTKELVDTFLLENLAIEESSRATLEKLQFTGELTEAEIDQAVATLALTQNTATLSEILRQIAFDTRNATLATSELTDEQKAVVENVPLFAQLASEVAFTGAASEETEAQLLELGISAEALQGFVDGVTESVGLFSEALAATVPTVEELADITGATSEIQAEAADAAKAAADVEIEALEARKDAIKSTGEANEEALNAEIDAINEANEAFADQVKELEKLEEEAQRAFSEIRSGADVLADALGPAQALAQERLDEQRDAVDSLGGSLEGLPEKAQASLADFRRVVEEELAETALFIASIQTLVARGADDLAAFLLSQGQGAAAAAAEAAGLNEEQLAGEEAFIEQIEGLNNLQIANVEALIDQLDGIEPPVFEFIEIKPVEIDTDAAVAEVDRAIEAVQDALDRGEFDPQDPFADLPARIIENFREQETGLADFSENIAALLGAGFTDTAALLLIAGPEAAGQLAAQLVSQGEIVQQSFEDQLSQTESGIETFAGFLTGTAAPALAASASEVAQRLEEQFGLDFDLSESFETELDEAQLALLAGSGDVVAAAALVGRGADTAFLENVDFQGRTLEEIKGLVATAEAGEEQAKDAGKIVGEDTTTGTEEGLDIAGAILGEAEEAKTALETLGLEELVPVARTAGEVVAAVFVAGFVGGLGSALEEPLNQFFIRQFVEDFAGDLIEAASSSPPLAFVGEQFAAGLTEGFEALIGPLLGSAFDDLPVPAIPGQAVTLAGVGAAAPGVAGAVGGAPSPAVAQLLGGGDVIVNLTDTLVDPDPFQIGEAILFELGDRD